MVWNFFTGQFFYPLRFCVNNSINFVNNFSVHKKFSFTHFLAILQNIRRICMVSLKFLADVCFSVSQCSNIWIALNSEPLDRFEWITPRWKAFLLLFSNIMRFTFFRVIFLLRSAGFHWFHKKYVMWHHSTTFNPIWCFWYTYWPPMGYQNVDLSENGY